MSESKQDRRVVSLNEPRFKLAEAVRNVWVVNAEQGTTVNDVLEPAYWAHVAQRLRPYDHIEVRIDTGEWLLSLLVLGCDRNWAKVHVLHRYELEKAETDMPKAKKHRVEWKGPQLKWCVIRNSDNEIIFKEMEKAEAHAQMAHHEALA
jgi:hypothetical protein